MKAVHVMSLLVIVLTASMVASARELIHPVQPRDGKNVVERTGEVLDFQLTAEREEGGNVLVRLVVPAASRLQKASHLRLEIRKGGKILLWSPLATRAGADGATETGLWIDESLAADAFVSFVYDGPKEDRGGMMSYQVAVRDYVKPKRQAK